MVLDIFRNSLESMSEVVILKTESCWRLVQEDRSCDIEIRWAGESVARVRRTSKFLALSQSWKGPSSRLSEKLPGYP